MEYSLTEFFKTQEGTYTLVGAAGFFLGYGVKSIIGWRNRARKEQKHQRRLEIAEKLAELKPVLENYLAENNIASIHEERDAYRKELVEGVLSYINEHEKDKGGVAARLIGCEPLIDEDIENSIETIVDMVHPIRSPSQRRRDLPPEIRTLLKLLRE